MRLWHVWGLRAATVFALGIFLMRAGTEWLKHPSVTLTLVIIGEVLTITIYLLARPATKLSSAPIATISTLVGTFFFYFVVLEPGQRLAPVWLTALLQGGGITWQIFAKLSLGRSFGLLPANRGVVTKGAYRLVRHPIYLGYAINHLGFLLASFNWQNLWLFCALYFFQFLRILEEEKLLKQDAMYANYMLQTKYRILPGIL